MRDPLFEFEFPILRGRVQHKLTFSIEERYQETCLSIDVERFLTRSNTWTSSSEGFSIPIRFLPTLMRLLLKCEKVLPLL